MTGSEPSKVYVAMICDRHRDPEPYVFPTPDAAVEFARAEFRRLVASPDGIEEHETDGWLYHATYVYESDSAWVVEKEFQGPRLVAKRCPRCGTTAVLDDRLAVCGPCVEAEDWGSDD